MTFSRVLPVLPAGAAREGPNDGSSSGGPLPSTVPEPQAGWAALEGAVAAIRSVGIDELDHDQIGHELGLLESAIRQLKARQARLAACRAERARRQAAMAAEKAGRPGHAAGERAARRSERQLANELGWTPGQSKHNVDLARQLDTTRPTGHALDEGHLTDRHAKLLADTLRWITDRTRRDELEEHLLRCAREQDPVTFGQTCRAILAEHETAAADRADTMRHRRRTGSLRQTDDGMVELSARVAGLDGELLMTAWHAFRRPDARGEHRTREQAGADALVALARAALDAGSAPSRHGTRPHVTIHLDWRAIAADAGVAEGTLTGPLPLPQIRQLLADCNVSALLLDRPGVALEATQGVRTVPSGLHRTLQARDRTCIADGCDVPAVWCQVMHLDVPYRLGGRLSPSNAALACTYHHTAYDRHGWTITWQGGQPILHHPDRPPRSSGHDHRPEHVTVASASRSRRAPHRPSSTPNGGPPASTQDPRSAAPQHTPVAASGGPPASTQDPRGAARRHAPVAPSGREPPDGTGSSDLPPTLWDDP